MLNRSTVSSLLSLLAPAMASLLLLGPVPAPAQVVRIDAGASAPYVDSTGQTWQPDAAYVSDPAATIATVYPPATPVNGSADPALYRSVRWAQLIRYRIPVPFRGAAVLTLKLCEFTFTAAGRRLTYVDLNGVRALNNFDILKEAPANTAYDKQIRFTANGVVDLVLYTPASASILSGIEIRPESRFVSVAPPAVVLPSGGTRQFSFSGTEPGVTWSTTAGSISPSGMFTAPVVSAAQNITVTAIGTLSATVRGTAAVTVTPPPPALSVPTAPLTFSAVSGGAAATPSSRNVAVYNKGGGLLQWTALPVPAATWLRVSPSAGAAPNQLLVSVNTAALAAGTYTAKITVAGGGASFDVPVTLAVTAPPTLTVLPATLSFSAIRGGPSPAARQLGVSNGGSGTLSWTAAPDKPWLSVTPGAGNAPPAATLHVSVNLTGLARGAHSGNIVVTSGTIRKSIPVTLNVTDPPALSVTPLSLTFAGAAKGAAPPSQPVNIANSGDGTLDWTASSNQPWLTLSAARGTGPVALNVTASPALLGPGDYSGELTVSGASTSKKVSVALSVIPGPNLTLSQSALTFTAAAGGPAPVPQRVRVTNPEPTLLTRTFPLNGYKAQLEGQWQGITYASDGKVYFASSTHSGRHGASFFQYDPVSGVVTLLAADITTICGEDPITNPQGKIHSDIVEANGWLYFSTHFSSELPGAVKTWSGSHLIGYQLSSGQFRDYGVIHPRYTSYSAVTVDAARNYVYVFVTGMTPGETSYVYRIDTVTGAKTNLGRVGGGTYGTCLWMFLDQRGDVWFSSFFDSGSLRRIRGATGVIDVYPNALPPMYRWDAEVATNEPDRGVMWMKAIDGDRAVFTIGAGGGMLYLFDASKAIASGQAFRNIRHIGYTDLGLAVGNNRVYYYQRANRQYGHQDFRDFHLMSVSLDPADGYAITDHGLIADASGRLLFRAPAMVTNGGSHVFLVGDWWTIPGDTGSLRYTNTAGVETYVGLPRGQFFSAVDAPVPPASGPAAAWTASSTQTWLSATPGSGSTPSSITVSVNTAGLPAGTYSGRVEVLSGGAVLRVVQVTLRLN